MLYPNNSIVNIEDIGARANALHCITDRMQCCRMSDGGEDGEWYQPGQASSVVGFGGTSRANFSRSRGPSAVLLNRRNGATSPAGLYRCEVPDSQDISHQLFIALYNASGGGDYNYHQKPRVRTNHCCLYFQAVVA